MNTTEKLEGTIAHRERLLAAMGGSPKGWTFTGEVTEGDPSGMNPTKCACGHVIRWEYHWEHEDRRRLVTGSVCVETLPDIEPATVAAMREALKKLLEARKEAERKAKAAEEDARVAALREELDAMIEKKWGRAIRYARETTGWLPPDIYGAVETSKYYREELSLARYLKTARGKIDRLKRAIEALKKRYPETFEDAQ